jgi:hypothetical protein
MKSRRSDSADLGKLIAEFQSRSFFVWTMNPHLEVFHKHAYDHIFTEFYQWFMRSRQLAHQVCRSANVHRPLHAPSTETNRSVRF